MCETIHLTAMGLWLGTLVMTGAAAAVLFPTMKELGPTLPSHAAFTGEHWRIVAGKPAATLFQICDGIQFVCAMLAAVSLLTLVGIARVRVRRRPSMFIRIISLGLAFIALSYHLFVLSPRMWTSLLSFRQAAAAGQNDLAAQFQAAFQSDHPTASNTLAAIAACVLVSLTTGIWAATTHADHPRTNDDDASPAPNKAVLEIPMLARNPRGVR